MLINMFFIFQEKIRETMEKAFWDSIMESVKRDKPNYDKVIKLVREVRDEICDMAPQSWKAEITEAIDLEILCQVVPLSIISCTAVITNRIYLQILVQF